MEFSDMDRAAQDALFEESEAASERVLEEWKEANTALDKKAKALIDAYLEKNGYDGVLLREDQGSFGRKVQTYIALHPEQVKNTDNATPTADPDVRFALTEEEITEENIIAPALDKRVAQVVAEAVIKTARETGVARI